MQPFAWACGEAKTGSGRIVAYSEVGFEICDNVPVTSVVEMKQEHDQARRRLWEEFCSWMKDHCFAENLTVLETSASQFQVKTSQGRKLHIEFNADGAGSVTYKFEDGAEQQLQMLVTIRSQAYFASDGKRYSAYDLGQKFLNR